jgi:hydroxyacylglutathione hydrolase
MKHEAPSVTVERLVVGQMASNCYLLLDQKTKDAIIIDPGDDAQYIIEKLETFKAKLKAIIATHGHFDHIMAGFELQHTYQIPFLVKRMGESAEYFLGITRSDPAPIVSGTFEDKATISYGDISLSVIQTAGHTPGSVCFRLNSQPILFVGDTIFADGGVGRTDFQYSDPKKFNLSLKKIFAYGNDTVLYPGHGDETTVGKEKSCHAVQYAHGL